MTTTLLSDPAPLSQRPPRPLDWKSYALDRWEPGALLSTAAALPEERDRYLIDGATYQTDLLFCVNARCQCMDATFVVRRVSKTGRACREGASARLPSDSIVPAFERGDPELLSKAFLAWSQRHVSSARRLHELRARVRARGRTLLELLGIVAPPAPPHLEPAPPRPFVRPPRTPRNAPCPCGSGKKHKKCCGR